MQFDRLGRRDFIALLGGGAAACPLAARAQQFPIRRVGIVTVGIATDAFGKNNMAAFTQGLGALGWNEGVNLNMTGVGMAPTRLLRSARPQRSLR
jgi:putative ABC transport system substrate-binding protein